VEAVVIATPEHLHHRMLLDAIARARTCTWRSRWRHVGGSAGDYARGGAVEERDPGGHAEPLEQPVQMAKTMISQG